VDGLNVWPMISSGNASSPWDEKPLPIDKDTLILGDWKLLLGSPKVDEWSGPHYPNASSPKHPIGPGQADCTKGCLFRVGASDASSLRSGSGGATHSIEHDVILGAAADPEEREDVSGLYPERVTAMTAALVEARKTFYVNRDHGHNCPACPHSVETTKGVSTDAERAGKGESCACWLAAHYYKGFFGPYQEVNVTPSPAPAPTPPTPSPPGPGPSPKRVAVRHELTKGAVCIAPSCSHAKCGVVATTCAKASAATATADVWTIDPSSGSVLFEGPADQNTTATDIATDICLRPLQPPKLPANCKVGQPLMIGESACLHLDTATTKIVSPDCKGLCAVMAAEPPHAITLGDCTAPLALGWSAGP
jgi:hypothetical protein